MPSYVMLLNWTDQGVKTFKDSVDRYEAARGAFEGRGISFRECLWTIGPHDLVAVVEAPDDETLTAAALMLAAQGNLRTTTLRGFNADEMRALIQNAG